jgi:hypothetical protein
MDYDQDSARDHIAQGGGIACGCLSGFLQRWLKVGGADTEETKVSEGNLIHLNSFGFRA